MTWQERSVSVDTSSRFTFKSVLGDVTITDRGIRRDELKREDEWELIRSEMPEDEIFEGYLPWDNIAEVTKRTEHLSHPHIDIELIESSGDGSSVEDEVLPDKVRLFFREDSPRGFDDVDRCFKTIKMMWNAHRQRTKRRFLSYSYSDERSIEKLSIQEKDKRSANQAEQRAKESRPSQQQQEDDNTGQEQHSEEKKTGDQGGITGMLETAATKPSKIMDLFGSSEED